ncbi:MAG: exodeoxyribonuclease VII large subunit [Betaproteobacteria bacterium]|nr:exodeoxyribonuclease VII large subunit [Betaproteobacteria bacterium]
MESLFAGTRDSVISVAELNRAARGALEATFPLLWVAGEVSGFLRHGSGHCYFTLKDRDAQVGCVMFRQRAALLGSLPANGERVEVLALVTLYEARGQFQLNVETLRRGGIGALFEAFERLKGKLRNEGLFDAARKRTLPRFPRTVGVVTSREGAALRDFLTTLARRMPGIAVRVYPTPVQGEGAAVRIANALRAAGERAECDVLVVCRGGGSIEDLWAFNEECVARAIAASPIPVVSGVGHETDFTIADFVADLRAPTPTAAAELVSPNRAELAAGLAEYRQRLGRAARRRLEQRMQQVDYLGRRLLSPVDLLRRRAAQLAHLASRLRGARARTHAAAVHRLALAAQRHAACRPEVLQRARRLEILDHRLRSAARRLLERRGDVVGRLAAQLAHLDPATVLARGYAIARRQDGSIVRAASAVSIDERLSLTFAAGSAEVRVEQKRPA